MGCKYIEYGYFKYSWTVKMNWTWGSIWVNLSGKYSHELRLSWVEEDLAFFAAQYLRHTIGQVTKGTQSDWPANHSKKY